MPYFGKYRGSVTDNVDPMQMGRLMVQVPDISSSSPSTWALPCFPVTGQSAGLWVLPAVGAGVWVEFEQGDQDYPIWTGCFPGSSSEVPTEAKNGMPSSPSMILQTLGNHSIVLSDVAGSAGGIILKTADGSKIEINSTAITISNGQGAEIKLEGAKVSVTGQPVTMNDGALEVS